VITIGMTREALLREQLKDRARVRRRNEQEVRRSSASGLHGVGGRKVQTRAQAKNAMRREVWA
jgi:hypothetical protein